MASESSPAETKEPLSSDPTVPRHVGIIMDGNGRWAVKRGLPRTHGHKEGLEAAKRIVARASDLGISCLSLYAFSTENWKRTEEEVSYLMGLIKTHLRRQYDFYKEKGIKVVHSGDLEKLPPTVREEILLAEEDTKDFKGLVVNLLINYGGRDEILRAARRCFSEGISMEELDEGNLTAHLDQSAFGDLDLLIRTGGELRTSNFLMWQAAYAELYFDDTYWPDWNAPQLDAAIEAFRKRQRRYGGIRK